MSTSTRSSLARLFLKALLLPLPGAFVARKSRKFCSLTYSSEPRRRAWRLTSSMLTSALSPNLASRRTNPRICARWAF